MSKEFNDRVLFCVRGWGITIERTTNTRTSLIVHGKRGATPIVLKVARSGAMDCGEIAAKFGGRGVVQVYESVSSKRRENINQQPCPWTPGPEAKQRF